MSEPLASRRSPPLSPAEPRVIGDVEQRRAQAFAVVLAVDGKKFVLRRLPESPSLALFRLAASGQDDPSFATILGPRLQSDIAVAREGPQIVADRRPVENERACQFGKRRGVNRAREFGQNRVLRRSEAARLERVIVELGQPTRRFARSGRETFAGAAARQWRLRHSALLHLVPERSPSVRATRRSRSVLGRSADMGICPYLQLVKRRLSDERLCRLEMRVLPHSPRRSPRTSGPGLSRPSTWSAHPPPLRRPRTKIFGFARCAVKVGLAFTESRRG